MKNCQEKKKKEKKKKKCKNIILKSKTDNDHHTTTVLRDLTISVKDESDTIETLKNLSIDESSMEEVIKKKTRKITTQFTTSIADLIHRDTISPASMFMSCDGVPERLQLTMVNYINNDQTYGIATDDQCMWDRHQFSSPPIGIPIRYHRKRYETHSYDPYSLSDQKTILEYDGYFACDGVVCSFPCGMAFIDDNRNNPLYRHSKELMALMYRKLHGINSPEVVKIPVAGHWRAIKGCTGNIPIEQFRRDFCRLRYRLTLNIRRPIMRPIGRYLVEERV
jgi:hypothetical protein